MNVLAPFLAKLDPEEIFKIVVIVIFILVPAVGQWLNKWAQAAAKKKRLPGPAAPLPGQPPRRPKGAVDAEIEDFLRRAGGRPAPPPRPAAGPAAQPRPAIPEIRRREVSRPSVSRPPVPRRQTARPERPLDVELIAEASAESVAEHVKKGVAERSFAQRTAHLADDVVQAEEAMESRLHETFGHKVGTLAGAAAAPAATPEAPAEQVRRQIVETPAALVGLAAMLADPSQMRQAVILQEILTRPEGRWK